MTALETTSIGSGPDVVLVHGVGVGAESFAHVAMALAGRWRVHVVARPTPGATAPTVQDQADALAGTLRTLDAVGARVVGTSGGATLVVAMALGHHDVVGSLVVHEPLLGRHAPALQRRFAEAALRATHSPEAAVEVVRSIMGETTWSALGASGRARVVAAGTRARLEIPAFTRFDPSAEELATLRDLPILTTVGARSGPDRVEAAEVLRRLTGAEVATLAGAANAAQLDAPEALAELIDAWRPAPRHPAVPERAS